MISRLGLTLSLALLSGPGGLAHAATAKAIRFEYPEGQPSLGESALQLGVAYGASWIVYPLSQPDVIRGKLGSWQEYRDNFGKVVFDHDSAKWNWLVHPYSGSQLYLFYRASGHGRPGSFLMTFLSSALFEFTIETYSEPASIQDIYQTPVLGTALGYGLEVVSTDLLNRDSGLARLAGRLLNPTSLLVDRSILSVVPVTDFRSKLGLALVMDF